MGVQGLWQLLAPVGRRVSVETLAGKRLAIDASIWMIQFMKAMRDERGEMVRNAHLVGFFRRICKLLFLRTKPVFVFDGGTPALKRRTVIARRRQRENAQTKIRKTAEKLLLNHVKAMRLKELANSLQEQKDKNMAKGKEVLLDKSDTVKKMEAPLADHNQEMLDEMLAASLLADEAGELGTSSNFAAENGSSSGNSSAYAASFPKEDEEDEDQEEMILPIADGNVDPAVLAALPPSMQLDLLVQMRERLMAENRQKYQKVKKAPEKFSELQIQAYLKTVAFRREIDQVQKAAAGKGVGGVQTSRIASESNREFIFSSSFSGDKEHLASSGAEIISEIQKRTEKRDASFEILNAMTSAMKSITPAESAVDEAVQTVIDGVGHKHVSRRSAMGIRMTRDLQRNLDLMKEFEQEMTTDDIEANAHIIPDIEGQSGESHSYEKSFEEVNDCNSDIVQNSIVHASLEPEIFKDAPKSETCIKISFDDEGMQRSLDGDDEFFAHLVAGDQVPICSADNPSSDCEWEDGMVSRERGNSMVSRESEIFREAPKSETCIKISFDDEGMQRSLDGDDGFFAHLVAGDQVLICSADNPSSDCEWEDGMVSRESGNSIDRNTLGTHSSHAQDANKNEFDVEWEEGRNLISDKFNVKFSDVEDSEDKEIRVEWQEGLTAADIYEDGQLLSSDTRNTVSKGSAEEEAALQEAIRRSLMDSTDEKSSFLSCDKKSPDYAYNRQLQLESCNPLPRSHLKRDLGGDQQCQFLVSKCDQPSFMVGKDIRSSDSLAINSTPAAFMAAGPTPHAGTKDFNAQDVSSCTENDQINDLGKSGSLPLTDMAAGVVPNTLPEIGVDDMANDRAAPTGQTASVFEEQTLHTDVRKTVGVNDTYPVSVQESHDVFISASRNEVEPPGSSLEDELLVLGQENKNLGDEQRKLERNADSVNAEMFVECQELLQMFGLPYIIAPMEAEAQCAYMELANLVDGVVTDDSDVFLFGAQSVYKNIFDDRKYVETYFMKDIESELGLNREKIIRMALLLGSDYTEGVSGIGIVNAIEVLNAFPEEDGLHRFREWIESPDPAIFGKVGVQQGLNSKKKVSKTLKKGMSNSKSDMEGTSAADSNTLLEDEDDDARNDIPNTKKTFMNKHRNVSKNWHIPASFPSDAVISAYAAPQVDKSTEPFAWGKPDIFSLRRLCWEKFGWASQKADELLLPVLKEYNKHETQLRLEAFYTFNERFAKIRSKRINQALKGITGKPSLNLDEADDLQDNPTKMEKTVASASGNRKKKSIPKKKATMLKRGSDAEKQNLSDAGSSRVRGRRRRAVGRGRQKKTSDSEHDETSIHDHNSSSDEHEDELLAENMVLPDTVRRRSKRARKGKAANYMEEDEDESDGVGIALNKNCSDVGTIEEKLSHNLTVDGVDVANASGEKEFASEDLLPGPAYGSGLPEDYLVKGGGFCAEEDETEKESNELGSIQSQSESQSHSQRDAVNANRHETIAGSLSNSAVAAIKDDGAPTSVVVNPFSAIPFLKRKRRKP